MRRRWLEAGAALLLAGGEFYWGLRAIARDGGWAKVGDDEVAVLVDHLSGDTTVITQPGNRLFVPVFQEIHHFDRSPNEYRMEGDGELSLNAAPQLKVRANDGSSFWFEEFTLHYAILPEKADRLLADSGAGERFKTTWIHAYAPSILRDEFGRYSAEDIVRPENLYAATRSSQERLNALLEPHGLYVLEINTPKPRFDAAYETAIERRKVANQTIEHLVTKRQQLVQEKAQAEARMRKEKTNERRSLEIELTKQLLAAESEGIRVRNEAEMFYQQRVDAAQAAKYERQARARTITEQAEAQAEAARERMADLEAQGELLVRAALIEKLQKVAFRFIPMRTDAAQRYELKPVGAPSKGAP